MRKFLIWTSLILVIVIATVLSILFATIISGWPGINFLIGMILGFIGVSWWIKYWNIYPA